MRQTDRQTDLRQTDVSQHHRLMLPPRGRGHNKIGYKLIRRTQNANLRRDRWSGKNRTIGYIPQWQKKSVKISGSGSWFRSIDRSIDRFDQFVNFLVKAPKHKQTTSNKDVDLGGTVTITPKYGAEYYVLRSFCFLCAFVHVILWYNASFLFVLVWHSASTLLALCQYY